MSDDAPSELHDRLQQLSARVEQLSGEREHYRQLYLALLERCEQLERGIIAERRAERHTPDDPQLSLQMLEMLLGDQPAPAAPDLPEEPRRIREHQRRPAGRKPRGRRGSPRRSSPRRSG